MRRMLFVGNDKIGHRLIAQIEINSQIRIILDKSSNLMRTWYLYRRGSLKLSWLISMAIAEILRKEIQITVSDFVKSNDDLLHEIHKYNIEQVYLFRAGLIINKTLLASGVDFFNIHCARIPDYGGLGAIARALQDRTYDQVATLHRITESIDSGEILFTEPYKLNPTLSFKKNEQIAYDAGMRLLLKQLQ